MSEPTLSESILIERLTPCVDSGAKILQILEIHKLRNTIRGQRTKIAHRGSVYAMVFR